MPGVVGLKLAESQVELSPESLGAGTVAVPSGLAVEVLGVGRGRPADVEVDGTGGAQALGVPVTWTESVTLPLGPMVMELELAVVVVVLEAAPAVTHSVFSMAPLWFPFEAL